MKNTTEEPQQRTAVRAILLTPDGEILLMQAQEPVSGWKIWFTPGGGLEPGEDREACLRRELSEETGLEIIQPGPVVWTRKHAFKWNGVSLVQEEYFYFVPTARFNPRMDKNPSEGEAAAFRGFRWWRLEEIQESSELFAPSGLVGHLASLIEHGPPGQILNVGV